MNKEQIKRLRKIVKAKQKEMVETAERILSAGGSLSDSTVLRQGMELSNLIAPLEEDTPLPGAEKLLKPSDSLSSDQEGDHR